MINLSPIHLSITTSYLLKSPDGYLLIDTGFKHLAGAFEEQLSAKGIAIADIKFILLTHHHMDHAGLLDYIVVRNPGVRVIMHSTCVPLVEKGVNRITEKTIFATKRLKSLFRIFKHLMKNIDTRCPYKARPDDIIIKGDDSNVLKEIGFQGTILHTPGHAEDMLSVYIEGLGVFCGDSMVNTYKITGNQSLPILFENLEQLYKSWEKIIATGARTVFPAHGKPCHIDVLKRNINMHIGKKHEPVLPVKK